ncbi:MAG: CDP-diacylglycerol--glycerol-3-phosphate 3-phosphatidyltransferase [Chthoniobacterales bacterium]
MNWANRLTLGRLVMTILFVISLTSISRYGRTVALILFALAGISDYFDGEIARRYGIVTNFGKLMDPLVDKVMMSAAFICLVPLEAVPAWVATIVVARDFLITGLRLLASSEGKILPAEKLGKHKTSWQIITVVFFLLLLSLRELQPGLENSGWWQIAWRYGGNVLLWITIGLTIYSGLGYLWRHRALVRA